MKAMLLVAFAAFSINPAIAQTDTSETQAPVAAVAPVDALVLRGGVGLTLKLTQELTTDGKALRAGDRFSLETVDPIVVQGVTVIPPGSHAVGEITSVRNKGMWGQSGQFTARLLHLTANGRQIPLKGEFDDRGRAGGVGAVAVSALVFLPAGFFMTGTSARLPKGTSVRGFIAEDVPIALKEAAPQVMEVPVPSN